MEIKGKKIFITGGAGFVGSHTADKLLEMDCSVTVYDNLKTGQSDIFLKDAKTNKDFKMVEGDILDLDKLKSEMDGHDFVFHLSANADVRGGLDNTRIDLEQNTIGTWNVLEAMKINNVKGIAFSSTSAMYGEPDKFPTPENYNPTQTSLYGASKLAGEAMIQAFCEGFGIKSWIFRFVSLIGERYTHGVIFDFIKKLHSDPKELEILGDGEQKKSYLYIGDCVNAMVFAIQNADEKVNTFNLGNVEYMNVKDVANIIIEEMKLSDVKFKFTGGEKGWIGDAPFVQLAVDRIQSLGWKPEVSIEDGIRKTAQYLLQNKELLDRR
jgi:UDP-glucose 4-epimerase|tara:strand:+ start:3119 stop:4090 length:972 start_codon:yes stop_codon:yes gene_type:complete